MRATVAGAPSSTAWPAANRALFIPFVLPQPIVVTQAVVGCGSTGSGNFDVGVYDAAGNLIVSSGATARSASSEVVAALTDTRLGEGLYYMALAADGTNNYIAGVPAQVGIVKAMGIKEAASSYTLPATVTYATASSAFIPYFVLWGAPQ